MNDKWFVRSMYGALGLLAVACVAFLVWTRPAPEVSAPASDMKLVSGDPRKDWVAIFHDQKRMMTCYIETQHGGLWCTPDIIITDQLGIFTYRDAGLP